jgi:selenocysteine-specific elongation factor
MIIGTAGHIDHGKSAVVAALTGLATDHLREERRRGITLDLHFFPLDLGDGTLAGLVDVPGHEDLVRTMVAGASGIDLALLVIAADDGIMPQTLEHLLVLEQLGVPAAIPVITKIDLVEPEWLDLVAADVAERLGNSPVPFGLPVRVSAVTGAGMEELRARIVAHAGSLGRRSAGDLFRLPIDRAFSIAGVGTVVTGTAWSGSVAVGDQVSVLPARREARVRSIEHHGRAVERSAPGARVALGLVGLERADVRRGDVVVEAAAPWAASEVVDVELDLHQDARHALKAGTRVRLHLGTAEVLGRVQAAEPVRPGERAVVRLMLERPLVARGGDRFVLRSYSPVLVIGGGRILDPAPPRRPGPTPALAAPESERLALLLERRRGGCAITELPVLLGLPAAEAVQLLARRNGTRRLGERAVLLGALSSAAEAALARLRRHHSEHPAERGLSLETLRNSLGLPAWLAEAAVDSLVHDGRLELAAGVAWEAGFAPRVAGGSELVRRLAGRVADAGLAPPSVAELAAELGSEVAAALRIAAAEGLVEAVERDRYYAADSLRRFEAALREAGAAGDITPALLRDRLGISRKYLIPLLEWADRQGITRRTGESRVLGARPRPASPA